LGGALARRLVVRRYRPRPARGALRGAKLYEAVLAGTILRAAILRAAMVQKEILPGLSKAAKTSAD
jgi:hypothetical protein